MRFGDGEKRRKREEEGKRDGEERRYDDDPKAATCCDKCSSIRFRWSTNIFHRVLSFSILRPDKNKYASSTAQSTRNLSLHFHVHTFYLWYNELNSVATVLQWLCFSLKYVCLRFSVKFDQIGRSNVAVFPIGLILADHRDIPHHSQPVERGSTAVLLKDDSRLNFFEYSTSGFIVHTSDEKYQSSYICIYYT